MRSENQNFDDEKSKSGPLGFCKQLAIIAWKPFYIGLNDNNRNIISLLKDLSVLKVVLFL